MGAVVDMPIVSSEGKVKFETIVIGPSATTSYLVNH
jgi:hypothetical protein